MKFLPGLSRFVDNKTPPGVPGGIVKLRAFRLREKESGLSVYMHGSLRLGIPWQTGLTLKGDGKLLGSCEIASSEVKLAHLRLEKTDSEIDSEHHVEICGWPEKADAEYYAKKEALTHKLASSAVFVPYDESSKNVTGCLPCVSFLVIVKPSTTAKDLELTLQSIKRQSNPNWECCLIFNGHIEDAVYKVVESFQEAEPDRHVNRFRLFEQEKRRCRWSCLRRARRLFRAPYAEEVLSGVCLHDSCVGDYASRTRDYGQEPVFKSIPFLTRLLRIKREA